MNIDYTEIIIAFITLVGGALGILLTKVLVPYIKLKIEESKSKLSKEQLEVIEYWTGIAVVAFEKKYPDAEKAGPYKKSDVIGFVKKMNLPIDDLQLSAMVDYLVEELINKPYYEFIQE